MKIQINLCLLTIALNLVEVVKCVSNKESKEEFHQGRYTRDIPKSKSDLVVPRKVTAMGEFLSHSIPHHYKRSYYYEKEDKNLGPADRVHYRIPIEGEEHHLELEPNHGLMSPGMVVESRHGGDDVRIRRAKDTQCHYHGQVRGHDARTALSTCYGLTGLVRTKRGYYIIEPLKDHDHTSGKEHPHVLYKMDPDEVMEPNCRVQEGAIEALDERAMRQPKRAVQTEGSAAKDINTNMFLETLVVIDKPLLEFHKSYDVENYALTIMNMVYNIYQDASLGAQVDVSVVRIIRLEDEKDEMNMAVNKDAETTLTNFCEWQKKMNPGDDTHPNHHDVAVLLTRVDICYDNTECGLLGLAKMGGTCDPTISCAINEDNGLILGYTVAHEMAHTLGVDHDEQAVSGCTGLMSDGKWHTVMNPTINSFTGEWSTCTQSYFKAFIDAGFAKCMLDEPSDHNFKLLNILPGAMYGAEYQCKALFAPEAIVCEMGITCDSLNCKMPTSGCYQSHEPPVPGTACGEKKWCYKLQCLEVGQRPGAVDGGWGGWGPWSECSRTCGSGVTSTERHCDKPKPSNGGKYCIGERKRHKICSTEPCEVGKPSFRDVQCSEFNDWIYPESKKKHTWKGVFLRGENPCTLSCINENKTIATLKPMVVDGTTCHRGLRDICIGGACREIPCDLDIESKAVEDVCGVCHGDGTECSIKKGKESLKQNMKKLLMVVDIPEGTRNIRVQEVVPTKAHIVVKEGKKTVINGDKLGMFQVSGSKAWLGMIHNNQEALNIPGPVTQALSVMVRALEDVDVEYSMALKKGKSRRGEAGSYQWDFIDWSPCSAQCGPGVEISVPKCVEKEAGLVEEIYCKDLPKPDDQERPCYLDPCTPRWMIGDWSTDCVDGKRTRIVKCVKPTGEGEGESVMIADSECKGSKPASEDPCGGGGSTSGKCSRRTEENEKVAMGSSNRETDEVGEGKRDEEVERHLVKRSSLDRSRRVDFLFSPDVINNEKNVYTKSTKEVRSSKDVGLDKKETEDKMTEDKIHPPKWKRSKELINHDRLSSVSLSNDKSSQADEEVSRDALKGIEREYVSSRRQAKRNVSPLSQKVYLPGSEYLDQDLTEYEEGPKASAVEKSADDIRTNERPLSKRSPGLHMAHDVGLSFNRGSLDDVEASPLNMEEYKQTLSKRSSLLPHVTNDMDSTFERRSLVDHGESLLEVQNNELNVNKRSSLLPHITNSVESTLNHRSHEGSEQIERSLNKRSSLLPHMSNDMGSPLDRRYMLENEAYQLEMEEKGQPLNKRSSLLPSMSDDIESSIDSRSSVENEARPIAMQERKQTLSKRNSMLSHMTNDVETPLYSRSLIENEAYPLDMEEGKQSLNKRSSILSHMTNNMESPLDSRSLVENEAYPINVEERKQSENKRSSVSSHTSNEMESPLDRRYLVENKVYPVDIEEKKQSLNKRSSMSSRMSNEVESPLDRRSLVENEAYPLGVDERRESLNERSSLYSDMTNDMGSPLDRRYLVENEAYPVDIEEGNRFLNKRSSMSSRISNEMESPLDRRSLVENEAYPIDIEERKQSLNKRSSTSSRMSNEVESPLDRRSLVENEAYPKDIEERKQSLNKRSSTSSRMSNEVESPLDRRSLVENEAYPIDIEERKQSLNKRSSMSSHMSNEVESPLDRRSLEENEAYPIDIDERKQSLNKRSSMSSRMSNEVESPLDRRSLVENEAYPIDIEERKQSLSKRSSVLPRMTIDMESPLDRRSPEENEAYPIDMEEKVLSINKRSLLPHMANDVESPLDRRSLVESEVYPLYMDDKEESLYKRSSLLPPTIHDVKPPLGHGMLTDVEQPMFESSRIDVEDNDRPLSLIDLELEKEMNDNLKKRYAVSRGFIEPGLSEDMVGPEVLDDLVGARALRRRSLLQVRGGVKAFPSKQLHDADTMPMDRVMDEGVESQAPIMASGVENEDWQPVRSPAKAMTKRHSTRKHRSPTLEETSGNLVMTNSIPRRKLDVMIPIEVSFLANKEGNRKHVRSYEPPSGPMKSEPDHVFIESVASHGIDKEITGPKQRFFSRETSDELSKNNDGRFNSVEDSGLENNYVDNEPQVDEEQNKVVGFYGLNSGNVPFGLVNIDQNEAEAAGEEYEEDDLMNRNNRDVNSVRTLSPEEEGELLASVNNEADYGEGADRLDRLVAERAHGMLRTRDTQSQQPMSVLTAMDMSKILAQHLPSDKYAWKMRDIGVPVGRGRVHDHAGTVRRATKRVLADGGDSKQHERCANNSLQHGESKGSQHKLQRGQTVQDKIKPESLNFTVVNESEDDEEGSDTTVRVEGKEVLDAMEKAQEESHTQAPSNKPPGGD